MGVSRTYAEKATLNLRAVEVCMSIIAPSKELLQMIEERIPKGRFLTTAALLLVVIAIIVGACGYLYRTVLVPAIGIGITLVKTGTITRLDLAKIIAGMISTTLLFFTLEWLHRGSSRLMREVLDNSKEVLSLAGRANESAMEANEQMREAVRMIKDLDARVSTLEDGHL
jgi:hypothetical protein